MKYFYFWILHSFKILQLRWVVLCIFTYRIFSFWTCSVLSMLYNYMCQENVNGSLVRNKYFFEISPKKYFRRILYQMKQPYIFFSITFQGINKKFYDKVWNAPLIMGSIHAFYTFHFFSFDFKAVHLSNIYQSL